VPPGTIFLDEKNFKSCSNEQALKIQLFTSYKAKSESELTHDDGSSAGAIGSN